MHFVWIGHLQCEIDMVMVEGEFVQVRTIQYDIILVHHQQQAVYFEL